MSGAGIRGLAASNIAWDPSEDDAMAAILREGGFTGVEIAPTKRWESPIEATKKEIAEYRVYWKKRGLEIVAMQALLYGRNDLQLFGSTLARRALREYLTALIEMASGLGAQALVFGSPKNRRRGSMPPVEANEIACEFFREMGAVAAARGCVVCIEPNPPAYDCDYITTTTEAIALCEMIGSRGVRVQCDTGAIAISGDDADAMVRTAGGWIGHVHHSEPSLDPVNGHPVHGVAASALRSSGYRGWISIEMRAPAAGERLEAMRTAVRAISALYTT